MSAKYQKSNPFLSLCIRIFLSLLLLVVGLVLIYQGIQRGIVDQAIVSTPSGRRGGGVSVYGSEAVIIGIGMCVLGVIFIYGAVKIFSERDTQT